MRMKLLIAIVLVVGAVYWFWGQNMFSSANRISDDDLTHVEEDDAEPESVSLDVASTESKSGYSSSPDQVTSGSSISIAVVGRVHDDTRLPVKGAIVVANHMNRELGRAKSGVDGTYRILLSTFSNQLTRLGVRATRGSRVASASVYVGDVSRTTLLRGERKVRDLTLRQGQSLDVRVVHKGEPVAGAIVYARERAMSTRHIGGFPVAARPTGRDGTTGFELVSGARVDVFVAAEGYGRAHQKIALPSKGVTDVELPKDRTVTVSVVEAESGAPVKGAEVHFAGVGTKPWPHGVGCLPPLPPMFTGEDGKAVIAGAPPTHIWVVARAPDLVMVNVGLVLERTIIPTEANEITVRLHRYVTHRFPIADSGVARPTNGTVLELVQYKPIRDYYQSTPKAYVEDDLVVLDHYPPGYDNGHVVAPSGVWGPWQTTMDGKAEGAVVFRNACDLSFNLTWEDGTPAAGINIGLSMIPHGRRRPSKSNEQGVVTFERCCAEDVLAKWHHAYPSTRGPAVADVTLAGRSMTVDITLPSPRPVHVHVTIEGEPMLPRTYRISAPHLVGSRLTQLSSGCIREDRKAGRLEFSWPLRSGVKKPVINMTTAGFPDVIAPLTITSEGHWHADVAFDSTPTLRGKETRLGR